MAHNPDTTILITRPANQGMAYGLELADKFPDTKVILSPLLEIVPLQAELNFAGVHRLLFTSVNAVEIFATLTKRRDIPALCVGDKTAKAATAIGLNAISANGSIEDLRILAAAYTKENQGDFLYLRGRHVAGPLGFQARETIIYEQHENSLSPDAMLVLAAPERVIIPLFSPRTAAVFMRQIAGVSILNTCAVCISKNVAKELNTSKFAKTIIAKEPNALAVTREIAAAL